MVFYRKYYLQGINVEVLERLNKETYIVQHNPNCPSPFLVRLVGPESGVIDLKYYDKTKDVLGFGKTLEEAAQAAFTQQAQYAEVKATQENIIRLRKEIESRKKAIQAQLTLTENELIQLQERCKHPNKHAWPEYDFTAHECGDCGAHWSTK